MLSRAEKRFIKTPASFSVRKSAYTKKCLERKITDTANDVGLLIANGFDVSEIILSIKNNSTIRTKQMMSEILKATKILDEIGCIQEQNCDVISEQTDDSSEKSTSKWDF